MNITFVKSFTRLSLISMTALAIVACSDSDNDETNSSETAYMFPLSAAAEVPPLVLTEARGEGNLLVDTGTGAISGIVTVSGLSGPATMVHMHQAPAGENGSVVFGLDGNADSTIWTIPEGTVLDTPQLAELIAGNMYINVHTAENPGGEIRGQIRVTTEFTVRIDNVSDDQTLPTSAGSVAVPLSPGIFLVHRENANPLLEPRNPASEALEALAEDGDASLFPSTVPGSVVFNTPVGSTEPGPLFPGDYYTFSFRASPGDSLAIATMFVQSNDWFYSTTDDNNDSISLFDSAGNAVSGDVSDQLSLWESGTEVDEEPGVGLNQAPRQAGPNTGASESESVGSLAGKGKSVTLNGDVIRVTINNNQ